MNDTENCRALVEHLQHEHGRLNQALLEIGHEVAAFAGTDRPRPAAEHLAQRLRDLRVRLQAHFAEEESGGCLEEAETRCPSLASQCQTVVNEHPVLIRTLEELAARAGDLGTSPLELQRDYEAFVRKLQAHEAAENRILQMAFGAAAADYDTAGAD